MSIAARCADCGKGYKVADEWAGKRIRCKSCGGVIQIPGTASGAPAAAAAKAAPARPRAAARPPRHRHRSRR